MPPNRSCNSKSYSNCCTLVKRVKLTKYKMYLYSYCKKQNRRCIVSKDEDLKKCSKCIHCSGKCNVEGIPVGNWISLERKEARLKLKHKQAIRAAKESLA